MMGGQDEQRCIRCLIPRSLEKVFQTRDDLAVLGWKWEIKVSMQEIYNDSIRDLLPPVSECSFKTVNEVCGLLAKAERKRAMAETKINQQSSKRHFIFNIEINGELTY